MTGVKCQLSEQSGNRPIAGATKAPVSTSPSTGVGNANTHATTVRGARPKAPPLPAAADGGCHSRVPAAPLSSRRSRFPRRASCCIRPWRTESPPGKPRQRGRRGRCRPLKRPLGGHRESQAPEEDAESPSASGPETPTPLGRGATADLEVRRRCGRRGAGRASPPALDSGSPRHAGSLTALPAPRPRRIPAPPAGPAIRGGGARGRDGGACRVPPSAGGARGAAGAEG